MSQKHTVNSELKHVDRVIREAAAIASDPHMAADLVDHRLRAKASTIGFHIDEARRLATKRGSHMQRTLGNRLVRIRQSFEENSAFNRCSHLRPDFLTALGQTTHQPTQIALI